MEMAREMYAHTLCKEVDARAVASHVKVVADLPVLLEPQLRKIIAPIISEQQQAARLQCLSVFWEEMMQHAMMRFSN